MGEVQRMFTQQANTSDLHEVFVEPRKKEQMLDVVHSNACGVDGRLY